MVTRYDSSLHNQLQCRFQEVVPLNAGNVLVIEDNEPASRWLALINQALNRPSPPSDAYAASAISEASATFSFSRSVDTAASASPVSALQTPSSSPLDPARFHKSSNREIRRAAITRGRRLKTCTCPAERPRSRRRSYRAPCLMGCGKNADAVGSDDTTTSDEEDDEVRTSSFAVSDVKSPAALAVAGRRERYCLVACKQMVGLFATVWVRRGLVPHVGHVRFSCVGRGIMGYLGNKVSSQQSRLIQSDPLQLNCLNSEMPCHCQDQAFKCHHVFGFRAASL